MTQFLIPPSAEKIHFCGIGHGRADYYVWEHRGSWYWSALGNDGKAATKEGAAYFAREWIKSRLSDTAGDRLEL